MQKTFEGSNRAEAVRKIFTEGARQFAEESGLPLGEALAGLAKQNPDLWAEYSSNCVPVQGTESGDRASSTLAAEMKAFADEHHVSLSEALQEVSKRRPDLWQRHCDEIVMVGAAPLTTFGME
jgi:hypothetical protein